MDSESKAATKPDTWMPLVIGDYLKDTGRLTTEQHGAYLLLIMDYWVNGPPMDDDDELAAIAKLDPKAWKRHRPKLVRFFTVVDGVWRHKRVDAELIDAAARKAAFAARASKGGKASAEKRRAAKSGASSTARSTLQEAPEGVLEQCSASISTEVDAPTGQSTLSGREDADERADGSSPPPASGIPQDVWTEFGRAMNPGWMASYLAQCAWQDVPARALIAPHGLAAAAIRRDAGHVIRALAIQVLERAA